MTGYGPSLFGNRLVRTRMLGGVGAGGDPPPATRLGLRLFSRWIIWVLSNGLTLEGSPKGCSQATSTFASLVFWNQSFCFLIPADLS